MPKKLWECKSLPQQAEWCLQKLKKGETLTEVGIWAAGANPDEVVDFLSKKGIKLKHEYVNRIDAIGKTRRVSAWKIDD